ncbi:unnamed protein product [Symbiodinium sp. CCMP2456]|nr:unnamed protein product [Symbiodinium sp. CCMP2456]
MAVDVGSPTEIAEDDDGIDKMIGSDPFLEGDNKHKVEVKQEKRKRDEHNSGHGRLRPVPDEEDEDLDSPTKRASRGEDQPLTAKELRMLLSGHVNEMRHAWGTFQGRLDRVEAAQSNTNGIISDLQARTTVAEKDIIQQRQAAQETTTSLDNLATEVKNMKVRIDELQSAGQSTAAPSGIAAPGGNPDPWAEFLRRKEGNKRNNAAAGVNSGVLLYPLWRLPDPRAMVVYSGWPVNSYLHKLAILLLLVPANKAVQNPGPASSSQNDAQQTNDEPPETPHPATQYWRTWTEEEIAEYKAQAWDDGEDCLGCLAFFIVVYPTMADLFDIAKHPAVADIFFFLASIAFHFVVRCPDILDTAVDVFQCGGDVADADIV